MLLAPPHHQHLPYCASLQTEDLSMLQERGEKEKAGACEQAAQKHRPPGSEGSRLCRFPGGQLWTPGPCGSCHAACWSLLQEAVLGCEPFLRMKSLGGWPWLPSSQVFTGDGKSWYAQVLAHTDHSLGISTFWSSVLPLPPLPVSRAGSDGGLEGGPGCTHTGLSPAPQCKNAEAGCLVTCPLARRREHQDSCPFELTACPNEGCTAQVPRGALADHQQHCLQSARQLCPLGCGATVGPGERARHNCYRELRDAWSARQERSRTLLLRLLQRLRQVHRTTSLIRRQLAQLGNFLEEDEMLLAGTSQGAEATPESRSGAQGQSTL